MASDDRHTNLPHETQSVSSGQSPPASHTPLDVAGEIAALRARVERLERVVSVAALPAHGDASESVSGIGGATAAAPAPDLAMSRPQAALLNIDQLITPARATVTTGGPGSAVATPPAQVSERAGTSPSAQRLTFEQLVGTRWYAAAGALALIVGLALFAKLAYDQGWLRVSPATRCVLVAVVGVLLVGGGEFVRRRVTRVGSIGLFAAGLGALYAAPLAATRLYDLIHPGVAFLLLIAVSGVGVLIAARLRFILVALVSLVGAYMAPILLSTGEPSFVVYPAYLLLLLSTGLFLSAFLRGHFVHIRTLVWYATILLGGFWAINDGVQSPIDGLSGVLFVAIAWFLIHAELLWAARRESAHPDLPPGVTSEHSGETPALPLGPAPRPFWRALALSIVTSTWAGALVTFILHRTQLLPDWTGVAGFAVGSALAALGLAGHLRFMVDSPRSDTERLGAVLGVEAAAMVIIAIALGLTGLGEIIAYMAFATFVIVAANWLRSRPLLVYACVVAAILTARLLFYDSTTALHSSSITLAGIIPTTWTLLVLIAAAIWTFAAWSVLRLADGASDDDDDDAPASSTPVARAAPSRDQTRMANAGFLVAAIVCGMASILHPEASAASIGCAWLGLAAVLAFGGVLLPRWPMAWAALVPLTFTGFAWMTVVLGRGWDQSFYGQLQPGPAILRASFLLAIAWIIAACVLPLRISANESASARRVVVIAGRAIAAGLFLGVTSAEAALVTSRLTTDPTTQAATVSIWWAVVAVVAVVGGFIWPVALVRRLGLALLGVAAIKMVVFDLADVSPVARIASFITLGVLMLGVAVIYGRVSRHLESPVASPTPGSSAR